LKFQRPDRIHFTSESDTRHKPILSVMAGAAGRIVTVYDASAHRDVKEAVTLPWPGSSMTRQRQVLSRW